MGSFVRLGKGALGFMQNYVQLISDISPLNDRLIMPYGMTVKDMYMRYRSSRPDVECIKEAMFYRIWSANFKHVTFQKVR